MNKTYSPHPPQKQQQTNQTKPNQLTKKDDYENTFAEIIPDSRC